MSISGLSENVSIHQTLGDNPNTDNNLSADELKALFDQAAEILKAYLNNIVVPEINRLAPLAEAGDENSEEALSKLAEMQNSITWALNKVDSALTTAESAKTIANGAYSFASQAKQQAKRAGDLARTAISQASGAVQLANQAKEAADNANENSAEALEKMNNSLPVSGGILTGPVGGTTASMDELIARSVFRLDTKGYSKINVQNDSDENDPAVKLGDDSGGPVRVTGVKTPVQDNDAANKSYVDAKIGSGSAGKDGGYYAISVTQPSNDKMRVTLTPSKSDMPTVPAVDIDLPAGEDGQDGKSPTVTVTDITGGHRITVTDATGTKTFNVMDGTPGAQGVDGGYYTPVVTQVIAGSMHIAFAPSNDSMPVIPPVEIPLPAGEDGEDGVSPTVSVTDITGGHRVTITDVDGTKTFDVMDGEDGSGGSVDIDDTLTQSGKAADAKTVGDALKLKYGIDGGDIQAINVTSSLTTDSGINVDFNGNRLKDVGDPVENGDAVNKKTLDQAISNVAAGSTMIPDGYCSTPAATAAKLDTFITASVTDGTPVMVNFVHQNTAENPTLTVNGVTAPILGMDAQPIAPAALTAGLHTFIYYTRYPGWVMLPEYSETNVDRTITLDESVSSVNIGSAANPLNLKRCVILLDINHDYTVRESAANGRIKTNGYNQGVVLQNMIIPADATYDRPYMIYMEAFGEIVYCFAASFNTTDDIVSNDNTVEGNVTWRAGRLIADNGRINTINIIGDAVDAGAFGAGTKIRIVGVE